jgi:hypothetical protein
MGYYVFDDCDALTINCAASAKPVGWHEDWNNDNRPVNWGVAQ